MDAVARAAALDAHAWEAAGCTRCPLSHARTQVVFGAGRPDAELMLVGDAPGFHEHRQGMPFVGQAGELLDRLLRSIGLGRADVYVANVLKCRPPGNRDPLAEEIAACEPHLFRQLELVRPTVVASLGNFATRLLSGRQSAITGVHGQPDRVTVAGQAVTLLPLYHPAAALYTPSMLRVLEADFLLIPGLLHGDGAPAPEIGARPRVPGVAAAPPELREPVQLGLF